MVKESWLGHHVFGHSGTDRVGGIVVCIDKSANIDYELQQLRQEFDEICDSLAKEIKETLDTDVESVK